LSKAAISKIELQRFAKVLRKARENAGLTHLELSKLSGVSPGYLEDAERGVVRPPTASKIARIVQSLPPSSELCPFQSRFQRPFELSPGVMDRLPDLLRIAREDTGISLRELARRSGVDAMYLSRLERGLVPTADWRKISAIAAQMPLSDLAKLTRVSGAGKLKHSALALAGDLEKLLASLPATDFEDEEWVSALQTRLRDCMMEVSKAHDWGYAQNGTLSELWKPAGRKRNPPCPKTLVGPNRYPGM
jgi:transcriptional regulator with XRE-family HTH domain